MAVAVGIPPAEVLELDAPLFDALELEAAAAREWSPELELAAVQAELLSALFVAQLSAGGVKGSKLPKPLRIPRPSSWSTSASSTTDGDRAGTSSSPSSPGGAGSFLERFAGRMIAPAAGEVH